MHLRGCPEGGRRPGGGASSCEWFLPAQMTGPAGSPRARSLTSLSFNLSTPFLTFHLTLVRPCCYLVTCNNKKWCLCIWSVVALVSLGLPRPAPRGSCSQSLLFPFCRRRNRDEGLGHLVYCFWPLCCISASHPHSS